MRSFILTILLASVCASAQSPSGSNPEVWPTPIPIRGRVLAEIDTFSHGAGVGPKYTSFIFGWEQKDGRLLPVRIAFAYFGRHGLPDSFFDYKNQYEMEARRDTSCDETVRTLSIVRNVTTSGEELPPTNVLHPLDGAPSGLLRPEMTLSCFVVSEFK